MSPFLTTLGGGSARGFGRAFRRTTTVAPSGQQAYTAASTYTFVVPAEVTSVSVVCVGGGQGGAAGDYNLGFNQGGSLSYKNNISVTPGSSISIGVGAYGSGGQVGNDGQVGGDSFVQVNSVVVCRAKGGQSVSTNVGDVSYVGGALQGCSGGGGAAGYGGDGGKGGAQSSNGIGGTGGGAGGGAGGYVGGPQVYYSGNYWINQAVGSGGGGGGVGILGIGASGNGGSVLGSGYSTSTYTLAGGGGGGSPGSGGDGGWYGGSSDAYNNPPGGYAAEGGWGGSFGGGGGRAGSLAVFLYNSELAEYEIVHTSYSYGEHGGVGAVRIIWGTGRSYPSNAANV